MTPHKQKRVAILYPGDHETRRTATPENSRFAQLFKAFAARGTHAEPAVYHDEHCDEVHEQLLQVDAVLVWVNPIQDGRDRSVLDSMLRDVAGAGVFVSTHPDIIVKLGTKEVLYRTRDVGWGCDTYWYASSSQMRRELPVRLATGQPRVLKQYRGHSGDGVWMVQLPADALGVKQTDATVLPQSDTMIRARHARRGCHEEAMTLGQFLGQCEQYFSAGGGMIDQEYQQRLPEGMIRCYLVHDKVAGFGHQAINALFPASPGTDPALAPQPGPRLYHPATVPEFGALKHKLEQEWVPAVQRLLDIDTQQLPILWDCDFLLGPRAGNNVDTHVLCEINVSSVAPYPESANPFICEATLIQAQAARHSRGLAP